MIKITGSLTIESSTEEERDWVIAQLDGHPHIASVQIDGLTLIAELDVEETIPPPAPDPEE